MMTLGTLVALHALSAAVWLGGMVFAHFCLRPAGPAAARPERSDVGPSAIPHQQHAREHHQPAEDAARGDSLLWHVQEPVVVEQER